MNILQLDLNLLKVLYVLLQTGSTGKTAQKLDITPSAVSHSLTRLRSILNDPLFRREGNEQIPTPYALSLKEKLLPLFISLNEDLFADSLNTSRVFRVVIPPALNVLLTPTLAKQGHIHSTQIECIPFERRSWRDDLLHGSIDLVLSIGDHQNLVSALKYQHIGNTRLIAIYGELLQHQFENKKSLKFDELCHYDHFYCHPWPQEINELDRQLARSNHKRNLAFICQNYEQIIPALRSAPLLAIVPQPWFENNNNKFGIYQLPLEDEKSIGGLFMLYRSSTVNWKKRIISVLQNTLTHFYQ